MSSQIEARVLGISNELAVGDGLDVEDQVAGLDGVAHGLLQAAFEIGAMMDGFAGNFWLSGYILGSSVLG